MIDLYAAPTTNGLRAKIMLDETGLDYKLRRVNMQAREHKSLEFLAMNPMGLTPVIVDHDGPGGKAITIPQSIAILFYLAEKSGKFLPRDPAARAAFWDPMMNTATDIGPTYGAVAFISRWPEADPGATENFQQRFCEYCEVWDAKLADQRYCAGDKVTIADFSFFGIFTRAKSNYAAMATGYANLDRWHDEIAARPGVQKGLNFD
jgi:GST-like protein